MGAWGRHTQEKHSTRCCGDRIKKRSQLGTKVEILSRPAGWPLLPAFVFKKLETTTTTGKRTQSAPLKGTSGKRTAKANPVGVKDNNPVGLMYVYAA